MFLVAPRWFHEMSSGAETKSGSVEVPENGPRREGDEKWIRAQLPR